MPDSLSVNSNKDRRGSVNVTAPTAAATRLISMLSKHAQKHPDSQETPSLFAQLNELCTQDNERYWRQMERWVKYVESVDVGGNRWSKPHVSSVHGNSLIQARDAIADAAILLDVEAGSLTSIAARFIKMWCDRGLVDEAAQNELKQLFTLPIRHQFHYMSTKHQEDNSTDEILGNLTFYKKLPMGCEAATILLGETELVDKLLFAFVRLESATFLKGICEVPCATRFIVVCLEPCSDLVNNDSLRQFGAAFGTLFSDSVFKNIVYKCDDATQIQDAIDEFMQAGTVLPPSSWNPAIRLDPPKLPSNGRAQREVEDGEEDAEHEDDDGHGNDPALKWTRRPFGGLIEDIKRKAPHYISDFTQGFNVKSLATIGFMYFAVIAPIITFGGLLEESTGQRMAAFENLLSGFLCGCVYALFAGQPLTIISSTGPVLIFEQITYRTCLNMGIDYLSARCWINWWTAVICILLVATDASCLVSFITRFTEESFAALISVLFIKEALGKLWQMHEETRWIVYNPDVVDPHCDCIAPIGEMYENETRWFDRVLIRHHWNQSWVSKQAWYNKDATQPSEIINYDGVPLDLCHELHGELHGNACYQLFNEFFMSLVLVVGTFALIMTLKSMRNRPYFPSWVRTILSDFSVMITIVIMVGVDLFFNVPTAKLNVPSEFRPTYSGRDWIVDPFVNPVWTWFAAILPALFAVILYFMDQQITAVIVNRKENKLKKGAGYHLDLLILSLIIFACGILGLPIFIAATVMSINHVEALKVESSKRAPGEKASFVGVLENRLTNFVAFALVGCSIFLTEILKYIPMAVLYGVFFYMGVAALNGIQLIDRLLLMLMPKKSQPDVSYLRQVPMRRIHLFTCFQAACLVTLFIVKSIKPTAILFPIMLVVIVAVRKLMECIFTENELKALDDKMPAIRRRKHHFKEGNDEDSDNETSTDNHDIGGDGADQRYYNGQAPCKRSVAINSTDNEKTPLVFISKSE